MKVNEAPKKIYISNFDIEALPKNEQLSERWHEVSTQDTDIEYTRTDAFIEKAEEFIYSALNDGIMGTANIEDFIRLFKKYIKGE